MPHQIRLRYPWTREPATDPSAEPVRVNVPDDSPLHQADVEHDELVYRRRFNQPTGLQPGHCVWLEIGGWTGQLRSIQLNEHPIIAPDLLAQAGSLRLDITEYLQPHNVLSIQLRNNAAAPRLTGECNLVIDP